MTAQTEPGSRRDARAGWFLRRRWRRVDRAATGVIAAAAVVAAVQLGVSAPTVSPVQPPAASATGTGQASSGAPAAADPGPLFTRFDGGRRGDRGRGGDRGGFR